MEDHGSGKLLRAVNRLDINRDNELLQRFVRINLDENEEFDEGDEPPLHPKMSAIVQKVAISGLKQPPQIKPDNKECPGDASEKEGEGEMKKTHQQQDTTCKYSKSDIFFV